MKTGRILLCILTTLFVVFYLGGCATGKYVPKPNEEFNGTWINEKILPQKIVLTTDAWKWYNHVSDSATLDAGTWQITSKWKDSEGNIWYKTLATITSGYAGQTFTQLGKLSKSGTVWESVWTMPSNDQELNNPRYPTKIDPKDSNYGIYYRAEN